MYSRNTFHIVVQMLTCRSNLIGSCHQTLEVFSPG